MYCPALFAWHWVQFLFSKGNVISIDVGTIVVCSVPSLSISLSVSLSKFRPYRHMMVPRLAEAYDVGWDRAHRSPRLSSHVVSPWLLVAFYTCLPGCGKGEIGDIQVSRIERHDRIRTDAPHVRPWRPAGESLGLFLHRCLDGDPADY